MHSIIEEILSSAKQRKVNPVKAKRKGKRDFSERLTKARATGRVPLIAEVKPASPLGEKRVISPAKAASIAVEMERAGASAISVLTEEKHFNGSIENLEAVRGSVSLPVLRKDFIVQREQICEVQADMILLIAGILGKKLKHFAETAIAFGMEPLVEVHNEADVENALDINAKLIGINNRDFNTLGVDLRRTERLAPFIREKNPGAIIISESGIKNAFDVKRVISAGGDGILVGRAIMSSGNIAEKTLELVNALEGKR